MCQALEDWKAEILTEGVEQGIKALVLDNLEEGKSREQIILKLKRRFSLDEQQASQYYERFTKE